MSETRDPGGEKDPAVPEASPLRNSFVELPAEARAEIAKMARGMMAELKDGFGGTIPMPQDVRGMDPAQARAALETIRLFTVRLKGGSALRVGTGVLDLEAALAARANDS